MQRDIVLQVDHLKKAFGTLRAVDDVSLSVPRGSVFGFLGPNGAGKTTTISMILGLLHPTAGSIRVFGEPVTPGRSQALRRVGALVGSPALVPYLSARQNLLLAARISPGITAIHIKNTLDRVGLLQAGDRKAGTFSTGMKQRLGLALALLHSPELLILDEPTNGMDPAGMREVRNLLSELSGAGVTTFISSHLLHEIEQTCDRVAVLSRGQVVAVGPVGSLLGGVTSVRVKVDDPARAAEILRTLPEVIDIQPNGATVTVRGPSSQAIVRHLVAHGEVPSEVINLHSDLESLFLQLTGDGSNPASPA